MTSDALLAEVLALPVPDRAKFLRDIAASIEPAGSPDVEEKWAAEITRRLELYREEKLEAVPPEQVFANIRAQLREARG